jgi:excisionase family DNA binding protein
MNRPRHYKKRERTPSGSPKLAELVTVSEASALWGRSRDTIYGHIARGNLAARQSGTIWLISKDSLIELYGHSPLIKTRKKPTGAG